MVVRRPIFTEPHEALLVCQSIYDLHQRFGEFADVSGISEEFIISSTVSAVPLPDYRGIGDGLVRWVDTNPLFMWHPFMWLPERLATRRILPNPDSEGEPLVEPDSVYSIRVLLELAGSGLYDPETGTWLDVLSAVDLDITQPEVQERVSLWLNGGEDLELDAIDLSVMLPVHDVDDQGDWAFQLAVDLVVPALQASWAVLANDLHELVANVVTTGDATDVANILTAASYSMLTDLTDANPTMKETWSEFLNQTQTGDPETLVTALVPAMLDSLANVRDQYWHVFETFPTLLTESVNDGSDTSGNTFEQGKPSSRPTFETPGEQIVSSPSFAVDPDSDPLTPPIVDSSETVTVVPPSPWVSVEKPV